MATNNISKGLIMALAILWCPYLTPPLHYLAFVPNTGEQGSLVARRGGGAVARTERVRQRVELHLGASSR